MATSPDLSPLVDDSIYLQSEQTSRLPLPVYRALHRRLSLDPALAQSVMYQPFDSSSTDISIPILNPNGQLLRAVMHRGRRYTDCKHNLGDSQVIFLRRSTQPLGTLVHGVIQTIFLHERSLPTGGFRSQVFAAVRIYRELDSTDAIADPYRVHPGLGVKLIHATLEESIEVLPMQDIISHFVSCPYLPPAPTPPKGDRPSPPRVPARASYKVVVDLTEVSASKVILKRRTDCER